jgi:hypothetical protein
MPVIGSDLHWYLSSSGASEGGAKSATEIPNAVDDNVFADVSDSARIAGGSQIRKIFLANENGVDAYLDHSIWVLVVPTNATPYIGLGFDDADDADSAAGTLVDFSAPAKVALSSDGADTRDVDIYGLVGSTPTKETVTLTGSSEVLCIATFDHIFALHASAVSASRTITIKEGAGGTTRGQITIGHVNCFRWLSPASSKSTGLQLPSLPTGQADGIWERFDWAPDAGAVTGNDFALKTEGL